MRFVLLCSAVVLAISGCTSAGATGTGSPAGTTASQALDAAEAALGPAGPTLGGHRAGDALVWLASTPGQPRKGDATMDVYVASLDGRPITDATVTLDTDMTNMSHGPYLVAAASAGSGHYVGRVHFLMAGPWRVITIVERPGQATLQVRFEFSVAAQ